MALLPQRKTFAQDRRQDLVRVRGQEYEKLSARRMSRFTRLRISRPVRVRNRLSELQVVAYRVDPGFRARFVGVAAGGAAHSNRPTREPPAPIRVLCIARHALPQPAMNWLTDYSLFC